MADELTKSEQVRLVDCISDSSCSIHTIALEVDEFLPTFTLTLTMESESKNAAVRQLCETAIFGWMVLGKDAEDLEFRRIHLISESDLKLDEESDSLLAIDRPKYTVEEVEIDELDELDEPTIIETYDFFRMVREDIL